MPGRAGAAKGSTGQSPRYAEVAADLTQSVDTGWYAVGAPLPSEAQLCKAYDISRFTAREALRRLEQAGLIERNRGRERRVIACKPPAAFVPLGAKGDRRPSLRRGDLSQTHSVHAEGVSDDHARDLGVNLAKCVPLGLVGDDHELHSHDIRA
jgi:DNA-binding transcriptional MocR family regulator